jgi:aldehyde dehydrogenase (NAD+)
VIKPLIGAIAAGNCVCIKPSSISAAVSAVYAELFPKYMDPKCIQVVTGSVQVSNKLLAKHWDYIMFTGSTSIAKVVMKAAAEHLTPWYL